MVIFLVLFAMSFGFNYFFKPFDVNLPEHKMPYIGISLMHTLTATLIFLMDLPWNRFSKFTLLTVGTFLGSWLIYEFGIRHWKIMRPLFGLKLNSGLSRKTYKGS